MNMLYISWCVYFLFLSIFTLTLCLSRALFYFNLLAWASGDRWSHGGIIQVTMTGTDRPTEHIRGRCRSLSRAKRACVPHIINAVITVKMVTDVAHLSVIHDIWTCFATDDWFLHTCWRTAHITNLALSSCANESALHSLLRSLYNYETDRISSVLCIRYFVSLLHVHLQWKKAFQHGHRVRACVHACRVEWRWKVVTGGRNAVSNKM